MVEKVHPVGPHNHEIPNNAAKVQAAAKPTTPTVGEGHGKKKKTIAQKMYPAHQSSDAQD